MAFPVNFCTFSKKLNSTKQPSVFSATYNCNLLENTSVIKPSLSLSVSSNPTAYNYAYIAEFGRYYFVTDWSFSDGLWIAHLQADVLATYKAGIGNSSQYVLRSAASYNGNVTDVMYPTTADITHGIKTATSPWSYDNFNNGVYILGIVGAVGGDAVAGSVKYWAFTYSQLQNFIGIMLGKTDWFNSENEPITEIGNSLTKVLFKPLDYIVSCRWFPVDITSLSVTSQSVVCFGWWAIKTPCYTLNNSTLLVTLNTIDAPTHPQSSTRGVYLNKAPFSRYSLEVAPWGCFEIDSAYINGGLAFTIILDLSTGIAMLKLSGDVSFPTRFAKVGVDVPISQIVGVSPVDVAQSFAGIGLNAISGNAVGALSGAISATSNFANVNLNHKGGQGTYLGLKESVKLRAVFYGVTDENKNILGRPLASTKTINTIPGYILCKDASLSVSATMDESEKINNFLNSGFFYE